MRQTVVVAAALALLTVDVAADDVKLFNGKDLAGWTFVTDTSGAAAGTPANPQDVWKVEGGRLRCTGSPNGYLRTNAEYKDFVLTFEWRWPETPGNSGVLLRVTGPDKVWPKSVEAQLQSGNAGDFWLLDGATLDTDPAKKDPKEPNHRIKFKAAEKPAGEWNVYEITMDGSWVLLRVNGEPVNEGTGAPEVAGKIGLQSEGAPIEFRNIRLSTIKK